MNNIIKIKSVKNLKNDLPNYTKVRSDEEKTLNYKLQNIETEKMEILDKKMEKVKEEIELAKEKRQNIENIKEIIEKIKANGTVSLDDLKSLNKSLSKIESLDPEDLEALYNVFTVHSPSVYSPKNVLENNGISLEDFNNLIREASKKNYSTSKGVILAGLALAEYSLITGENFRYSVDYATRREMTGIEENTYLDCSSFVFWALYNGGYNWPVISEDKLNEYYTITYEDNNIGRSVGYNDGIVNNNFELNAWAKINNLIHDPKEYNGTQGDYLLVNNKEINGRHIMMIIGENNDNYYVLEERGTENGLILNKRPKEEIIEKGYKIVDMQSYYNDDNNKRK